MKTYAVGELVRIKPEYQDSGDDAQQFVVLEDRGDRVLLMYQVGWDLQPTQVVLKSMLAN